MTAQVAVGLVDKLLADHDLAGVAARACEAVGAEGREEQVGYCLILLCQKADPARSKKGGPPTRRYRLDLDSTEFPERLEHWARTVAHNLKIWADAYQAIQDEADRYEITTLRSLLRLRAGDDVLTEIADSLSELIATSDRLEDMGLQRAREMEPNGHEYVFSSALPGWIRLSARRDSHARQPEPLAELPEIGQHDSWELLESRRELDDTVFAELVRQIADLAGTRELLSAALERAMGLQEGIELRSAGRASVTKALRRVEAELLHVADQLRREQRAFPSMVAYVALAMRSSPKRQAVTVLSLRVLALSPEVIEHISGMMSSIIADDRQPTPSLRAKTERASRRLVPTSRVKALSVLHAKPHERSRELAPVRRLLSELPATLPEIASIGPALPEPITRRSATASRNQAASELGAVDVYFERSFRRYAMGLT